MLPSCFGQQEALVWPWSSSGSRSGGAACRSLGQRSNQHGVRCSHLVTSICHQTSKSQCDFKVTGLISTFRWMQRKMVELYRHVISTKETEAQMFQLPTMQHDLAVILMKLGKWLNGLSDWLCHCVLEHKSNVLSGLGFNGIFFLKCFEPNQPAPRWITTLESLIWR